MAGRYEPTARCAHVAAAVENKVYVWGGLFGRQKDISHDGPDKTEVILKVDILDVKVRADPGLQFKLDLFLTFIIILKH